MAIYDRSTKLLMHEFAQSELKPGQVFAKSDAVKWFGKHYPKIKPITVGMHVDGMAVNSKGRKHHRTIRPGADWDLFLKLPDGRFRLWDSNADPAPIYRNDILAAKAGEPKDLEGGALDDEAADSELSGEFAYEEHLRSYLVGNLGAIESGLRLYEEEGFNGVQFPVGGRYIDILAVDREGNFVVIELKVSRGYDRAVGQLLRYMGWVQKNLAGGKSVRGIIVASEITDDLRLAASRIADVRLMEYELSFKLKPIAL